MLQDYITADRIVSSIMMKDSYKGSYVIVEGNNDYTLYSKFLDNKFCRVEIAFGNPNVISVLEKLNILNFFSVVGIIDSDFRNLETEVNLPKNLLLTDDHDLEVMLFKSEAFDIVLSHYANQEKLEKYISENNNKKFRDLIIELATPLAYLKWCNKMNDFGLVFKPNKVDGKPLPIGDFISSSTLKFEGVEKMIEVVFNYSKNKSVIKNTQPVCLEQTIRLFQNKTDSFQLCNGHDLIAITCLSLRKKIGSYDANAIKPQDLETALIFAYDSRHFELTTLYKKLKAWELKNSLRLLKF